MEFLKKIVVIFSLLLSFGNGFIGAWSSGDPLLLRLHLAVNIEGIVDSRQIIKSNIIATVNDMVSKDERSLEDIIALVDGEVNDLRKKILSCDSAGRWNMFLSLPLIYLANKLDWSSRSLELTGLRFAPHIQQGYGFIERAALGDKGALDIAVKGGHLETVGRLFSDKGVSIGSSVDRSKWDVFAYVFTPFLSNRFLSLGLAGAAGAMLFYGVSRGRQVAECGPLRQQLQKAEFIQTVLNEMRQSVVVSQE